MRRSVLIVVLIYSATSAVASVTPAHPQTGPSAPALTPPPPNLSIQPTSERSGRTDRSSILIPFDPSVGAAAFKQRDQLVVVFDAERPIDLSPLQADPVYGRATIYMLPGASVMRLPLPNGIWASLEREPDGWRIVLQTERPVLSPAAPTSSRDQLSWAIQQPGQAVRIPDDLTGSVLLIGTVRTTAAAVLLAQTTPQFVLRPTILGIVVEPLSDRLTLDVRPHGFALSNPGARLDLTPSSPELFTRANAIGLTTQFGLSPEPQDALFQAARALITTTASPPPAQRASAERELARKMIALGMGAEAQAMLHLAALRDPRKTRLADYRGLLALAALLANRLPESAPINDPDLSGTDEVTLWRALRGAALRENLATVGPQLASTWPLILSYGPALKQRLLPMAAETLIKSNNLPAAQSLLQAEPDPPPLALARAMLAEAEGNTAAALAGYDALGHERDPLLRVRAARRAIELRLATHQLTPAQAADAYGKLVAAWHGGHIERAVRERFAALLAESGKWQQSLAELRMLENDFPNQAEAIRSRRRAAFAAFLSSPVAGILSPVDFLTFARANADVAPEGDAGIALQMALADKLIALDFTGQAASALQKLLDSAPPATARAEIGARLAHLLIREGNAPGALEALYKSNFPDLPPPLTEQRSLMQAKALALQGNVEQAVTLLAGLNVPAADRLRAEILERKRDWAGAEQALKDLAGRVVPTSGPLTDAQRNTLLHLATAMTNAGDDAGLAGLRLREMERMGNGSTSNPFRILTEAPIHHVADLPNAEKDLRGAGALPGDLNSVH